MGDAKFCKDCEHYTSSQYVPVWGVYGFYYPEKCQSPDRPITPSFYVNGRSALADPIDERTPDGFCKPEAIHWAERPQQPVLALIEQCNALEKQYTPPKPWWKFWKQEG